MPLRTKAAKLEFYHPATGALRKTLTTNVRRIQIAEQARDMADDAGFDLRHDFANIDDIVPGDEVRVYVQTESDGGLVHIWTGTVDSVDPSRHGPSFADLPMKAVDWVYAKMRDTYVTGVWENMAVGAILRDAIASYASQIGTANVLDTSTTVASFIARDEQLLSVARRLAEIAGAEFRGDKDKNLHFFVQKAQSSGLNVGVTKVVQGSFRAQHSMAGFGNSVLIRGGSRFVQDQSNGTTPASYSTVNATGTRAKARVFVSKDRIGKVEIWTDSDTPSTLTGNLIVRIQADNAAGTAPIEEGNPDRDLASKTVEAANLTNNGLTAFIMPDHITPPGNYVWVIVEAGVDSQRVGLDGSGNLIYKTYFDVPIIVRREDQTSIGTYGRRELPPVTDTNVLTESDAEKLGDALVAAHKNPARVGTYEVSDMSLASVTVGQTVSASFPKDRIPNGTAVIIMEKRHSYDADRGTYSLRHAFADVERAQTWADILKSHAQRLKRLEDTAWDTGVISLLGQIGDTAKIADAATGTTQNAGTFVVGTARVGFSAVG